MLRAIGKLRGRSAVELRERVGQATTRWLERHGAGDVRELSGKALDEAIGPDDDGPVVRGPFFASLGDREGTRAALRAIDPAHERRLLERAERILKGEYDLLGHRDVPYGFPPDWWREPVAGRRAPDRHWSEVAYLDPAVVGDHKVIWELGRHQALVTLGQAAWLTGDARYSAACAQWLSSWIDGNPPKHGVHWASSLEVAFRSIAWVWALALVGDALPQPLRRRAVGYLTISARHVERYLSTWFSPNTHLTGEALGLFVVGTALPQVRGAARWRDLGAGILLTWLPRHVRPDGTYVEQSTWYHRYTTDFYLHFLALAERAGLPVRDRVAGPLGSLLDVLAWVTRPDGSMPLIGDDDGGRLLFLDEGTATATATPLAVGAALLQRGDLAAVAGGPTPEVAWLLGAAGVDEFRRLAPRLPAGRARAFGDGGMYVIREGWGRDAAMCVIDAGPHGFLNAGHAHADALSLDLTVRGVPILVDPGTYTYTVSAEWRDRFRSTAVHNAAIVDGRDSARASGPFSWATRVTAAVDAWGDDGSVVLFSGTHDGFDTSSARTAYRRTIVFLPPVGWIIHDEVIAGGEHELTVHWQCAPGTDAVVSGSVATVFHGGTALATVRTVEGAAVARTEGQVSPMYGTMVNAPHLASVRRSRDGVTITTLIADAGVTVRAEVTRPGVVRAAVGDHDGILLLPGGHVDGVETDARVAWVALDVAGVPRRVTAAGVTRLSVHGAAVPVIDGFATWGSS